MFLAERDGLLTEPAWPGLNKADQDVRDALALVEPRPHISAMLDWERVGRGESLWEVTSVFVRLDMLALSPLWPAFLEGYKREAGVQLPQGPQAEYYVMSRAVIAATVHERADRIIRALLNGKRLPFGG